MKRIFSFCLVAALAFTLAACGKPASSSAPASSAPASSAPASSAPASSAPSSSAPAGKDYAQIIQDSRAIEDNEGYNIIGAQPGGELTVLYDPYDGDTADYSSQAEMLLSMFTIEPAALDSFALSTTMVNIRAYGVGIFKPAEGKKQEVLDGINSFVTNQQKAFETYLQDQYEVAKAAIVEELPSGEILLVMSDGAADIAGKIKEALQ